MKVKPGVIIQKLGKTFAAYDNERAALHELNEVAFEILSGIEAGKSKKEIVSKMIKNYKISHKEAERDFEEFVKNLKSKDLIVGKK